jgi:hypothetical protein
VGPRKSLPEAGEKEKYFSLLGNPTVAVEVVASHFTDTCITAAPFIS